MKAKPAKAKAAQRVIEVLDFFDEQHREATVMDIARRYRRPQSSTSELLASLVELGLLYKDAASRSYTLTPRAAILGSLSQPRFVRDGRLATMVDELRAATGLGVALIGMVDADAQLFRWKPGLRRLDGSGIANGARERLTDTAAGWLLLAALPPSRRDGLIRRINAEAPAARKFNQREMSLRIEECARAGHAIGPAGFGTVASLAAVSIQAEAGDRPLVLGLVHGCGDEASMPSLVAALRRSIQRWSPPSGEATAAVAHAA